MVDNNFFVRCLGFSQDPKTSNFIIVMEFAPLGSLYAYLNNNMTWEDRITALLDISTGLNIIGTTFCNQSWGCLMLLSPRRIRQIHIN